MVWCYLWMGGRRRARVRRVGGRETRMCGRRWVRWGGVGNYMQHVHVHMHMHMSMSTSISMYVHVHVAHVCAELRRRACGTDSHGSIVSPGTSQRQAGDISQSRGISHRAVLLQRQRARARCSAVSVRTYVRVGFWEAAHQYPVDRASPAFKPHTELRAAFPSFSSRRMQFCSSFASS